MTARRMHKNVCHVSLRLHSRVNQYGRECPLLRNGNGYQRATISACSDYARDVFNSMHVRSKCSDCCEFEADTDLVAVEGSESEDAVRLCCIYKKLCR